MARRDGALKQAGSTRRMRRAARPSSRPCRGPSATARRRIPPTPPYRLIKQQNTFAFYTSRAGMIEALDYRGNSFNAEFPACNHPEHQTV